MSIFRKLAGETAIYGLPTIVGRLVNFFLVPLYTKIFTTAEYGIVSGMYAYAGFFNVLLTYGMETTFFRFASQDPKNDKVYSTAYNSIIVTGLLFLFLAIVFKQPIANFMEISDTPQYFLWFAVIAFFDALIAIPFVKLRLLGKAKRYAFARSFNIAVNIGLNLFFLVLCPFLVEQGETWVSAIYKPDIGIGYIFIANLVASVLTWPLVYPENFQFSFGFDFKLWKRMVAYSFPLLFVGMAGMINETIDRILLGKLLPHDIADSEIGVYSAAYKLSILMTLFIQAYRMAAEPFLFTRAQTGGAEKDYAKLMNYFIIVSGVIFLLVTFNLQFFADFFLQNKAFHAGLHVVPILLLANMFLGIYYNLSIWYKLADKTHIGSYIAISAAGITLLINFITIPLISYEGSAWATLVAYFFMAIACYITGKKHFPIPYQVNKVYIYILIMAVFYIIHQIMKIDGDITNMVLSIVFIGAYLGIAYGIEKGLILKNFTSRSV